MKIYIAGPMRGKEWFNFPAFDLARVFLRRAGWEVISPADLDREIGFDALKLPYHSDWSDVTKLGFDLKAAVQRDVAAILSCDAIFMLHGWSESRGAKAEKSVAEWLGLIVFYQVDGYPKVSEVVK